MAASTKLSPTFGNSQTSSGVDFSIETEEEKKARLLREVEDAKTAITAGQNPAVPSGFVPGPGRAPIVPTSTPTGEIMGPPGPSDNPSAPTPFGGEIMGPPPAPSYKDDSWRNGALGFAAPAVDYLAENARRQIQESRKKEQEIRDANAAAFTPVEEETPQQLALRQQAQANAMYKGKLEQDAAEAAKDPTGISSLTNNISQIENRVAAGVIGNVGSAIQFAGTLGKEYGADQNGTPPSWATTLENAGTALTRIQQAASASDDQSKYENPDDTFLSNFMPDFQKRKFTSTLMQGIQWADSATSAYYLSHQGAEMVGNMLPLILGGELIAGAGAGLGALGGVAIGASRLARIAKFAEPVAAKLSSNVAGKLLLKYGLSGAEALPRAVSSAVAESYLEAAQTAADEIQKSGDRSKAINLAGGTFVQGVMGLVGINGAEELILQQLLPRAVAKSLEGLSSEARNNVMTRLGSRAGTKGLQAVATIWKEMGEEGIQQAFQQNPKGSFAGNVVTGLFNPENDPEIAKARDAGGKFALMMGIGPGAISAAQDAQYAVKTLQDTSREDRRLLMGTYTHAAVQYLEDRANKEISALPPTDTAGKARIESDRDELISRSVDAARAVQTNNGAAWSNEAAKLGGQQAGVMARIQFASDVAEIQQQAKVLEALAGPSEMPFSQYLSMVASDNANQQIGTGAQNTTKVSGLYGQAQTVDTGNGTVTSASGNISSDLLNRIAGRSYTASLHTMASDGVKRLGDAWQQADDFAKGKSTTPASPEMQGLYDALKKAGITTGVGSAFNGVDISVDNQMGWNTSTGKTGINIYRVMDKFLSPQFQASLQEAHAKSGSQQSFEEYRDTLAATELQQTIIHEAGHLLGFNDDSGEYDAAILAFMTANDSEGWMDFAPSLAIVRSLRTDSQFTQDMTEVANAEGNATRNRLANIGVGQVQRSSGTSASNQLAPGGGEGFYSAGNGPRIDTSGIRARSASSGQPLSRSDSSPVMDGTATGGAGEQPSGEPASTTNRTGSAANSNAAPGTGGGLDDESRAITDIRAGGRTGPRPDQGAVNTDPGSNEPQRDTATGDQGADGSDAGGDSTESLLGTVGTDNTSQLGDDVGNSPEALAAVEEFRDNSPDFSVSQAMRSAVAALTRPSKTNDLMPNKEMHTQRGKDLFVEGMQTIPSEIVYGSAPEMESLRRLRQTFGNVASLMPPGSQSATSFVAAEQLIFADMNQISGMNNLPTSNGVVVRPPSHAEGQALIKSIASSAWAKNWTDTVGQVSKSVRDFYVSAGYFSDVTSWSPDPNTAQGQDLLEFAKLKAENALRAMRDPAHWLTTNKLRTEAFRLDELNKLSPDMSMVADYDSELDYYESILIDLRAARNLGTPSARPEDYVKAVNITAAVELGQGHVRTGEGAQAQFVNHIPFMMLHTNTVGTTLNANFFSRQQLRDLVTDGVISNDVATGVDKDTGFIGYNPFFSFSAIEMLAHRGLKAEIASKYSTADVAWMANINSTNAAEIWARSMIALMVHEQIHMLGIIHSQPMEGSHNELELLYDEITGKMIKASMTQLEPAVRKLANLYETGMANDQGYLKDLFAYEKLFETVSREISARLAGTRYDSFNVQTEIDAPVSWATIPSKYLFKMNNVVTVMSYGTSIVPYNSVGDITTSSDPTANYTGADYPTLPQGLRLTIPTGVNAPLVVPATHATLATGLATMRPRSEYLMVPARASRDAVKLSSDDLFGMNLAMRDIFGAPTKQTIGSMALDRVNGAAVPTTGYPPNTIRRAVQDAINAAEKEGRLPVATDLEGIPGAPNPGSFTSKAKLASDNGTMHPNIYQHLVELATYGQDAKTWYLDYAQFWTDWLAGSHNQASNYTQTQRTAMFIELLAFMGRAGQQTEPVENVRIASQIMEMRGNLEMRAGKTKGTTAFDDLVEGWRLAQEASDTFNSATEAVYANPKGNSELMAGLKKLKIGLKDKNTGLELQSSLRSLIYKRAEQIPNFRLTGKKGKEKVPYVHTWHDSDWKYWFENIQASDYTAMAGGNARIEQLIKDVQNIESDGTKVTASLFYAYSNDLKSGKGATVGQASTEQMKSMLNFWLYSTDEISANMKLANYAAAFRDSIENIITIFSVPDVWIFRSIGIPNPNGQGTASDTQVSEFVSALFADIASRMRVHPLQLQAMVWTGFRRRLVEGRELLQPSKDGKKFKSDDAIAIKQADGTEYIVDGVSMSDTQSAGDLDKVMRDPEVLQTMRALANQQFKNPEHVPVKAQLAPVVLPRMKAQREFAKLQEDGTPVFQRMELTFPGVTNKRTGELETPISERNTRDSGNFSVEVQSPRIFIQISSAAEWKKLDISEFMQTPLLRQESNAYEAGRRPGALTDEQRATAMDTEREGFGETINGVQPVRGMGGAGKTWMPHVIIRGSDFIEVLIPGVSEAHAKVIGSVLAHKIGPNKQAIVLNPTVRNGATPNALVVSAPSEKTPLKWGDMLERFADVGAQKVVISGGERIIISPRVGQGLAELASQMIDEIGIDPALLTVTRVDMTVANANPNLSLDISENQDALPQLVMESFGSNQGAPVVPKWKQMSAADLKAIEAARLQQVADLKAIYAKTPGALTEAQKVRAPKVVLLERAQADLAAKEAAAKAKKAGANVAEVPNVATISARSAISDAVQRQSQSEWASTNDGQWVRDYGYGFWGRVIKRVNADSLPADSDHLFRMAVGTRPTIMNASGHFSNNTYGSSEDAIAAADRVARSFAETEGRMRERTGLTDPEEARAYIDSTVAREKQSGDYQPPVDVDTWVSVADEMDQKQSKFPPSIDRVDMPVNRARSGMQRNTEGTTRQGTYIADPNTGKEILDESPTISMSSPATIGSVIGAHTGLRVSYDPSTRPNWQKNVAASQEDFLINALDAVKNKNGTLSIPIITQIAGPHEIITNRVGTWEGKPEFNIRVLFPTNADPALIKVAAAFLGRVAHQDAQGLFRPNSVINATDFTKRVGSNSDETPYNVVGVEIPASIVGNESDRAIQAVKQLAGAAGVGVDLDASGRNIYVVNYDPPTDADGNTDVAKLAAWAATTAIDIAKAFKADGVTTNDVFVGSADTNLVPSNWSTDDPYETYGTIIRDYEAGGAATAQGPNSAGQGAGGTGAINSQGVARLPVADYEQRAIEWNLDKGQIEIAGGGTRAEQIARVQQKAEEILGPNAQRPPKEESETEEPETEGAVMPTPVIDTPAYEEMVASAMHPDQRNTTEVGTGPSGIPFENQVGPGEPPPMVTMRGRSGSPVQRSKVDYVVDPKTGQRSAVRSITEAGLKMIDNSIYANSEFGKTSVREAYQNSKDAIRKAIKLAPETGQLTSPKDYVFESIIINPEQIAPSADRNDSGIMVFHDNGIGMTMDTITEVFVPVGGTDKGAGDSGGFGIGAGSIMSAAKYFEIVSTFIPRSGPTKGIPQRARMVGTDETWMSRGGSRIELIPTYTNSKPVYEVQRHRVSTADPNIFDVADVNVIIGYEIDDPSLPQVYIPHPDPIIEIAMQKLVERTLNESAIRNGTIVDGKINGYSPTLLRPSWVQHERDWGSVKANGETVLGYPSAVAVNDAIHDYWVAQAKQNGTPEPKKPAVTTIDPKTSKDSLWADSANGRDMAAPLSFTSGGVRYPSRLAAAMDITFAKTVGELVMERPSDFYDVVGYMPGLDHLSVKDLRLTSPTYGLDIPYLMIAYDALKANPDALSQFIRDRAYTGSRAQDNPSRTGTTISVWPKSTSKNDVAGTPLRSIRSMSGLENSTAFHTSVRKLAGLYIPTLLLGAEGKDANGDPDPINESQANLFVLPKDPRELEQRFADPYYHSYNGGNSTGNQFSWSHLDDPDAYLLENSGQINDPSTGGQIPLPGFSTGIDGSGSVEIDPASPYAQEGSIATLNTGRRIQGQTIADQFVAESFIGPVASPSTFIGQNTSSLPVGRTMGSVTFPGVQPIALARLTASQELAKAAEVIVLSNGAYQFKFKQEAGDVALPRYLVLDIKTMASVQANDTAYPFTASRDQFKSHVQTWWQAFVAQELISKLAAVDTVNTIKIFDDAPEIGNTGYKLLDAGRILTKKGDTTKLDELLASTELADLTVVVGEAFQALKHDIRTNNIYPPQDLFDSVFFGITVGSHIGVNYNVSILANNPNPTLQAMASSGNSVVGSGNSILFNPFQALLGVSYSQAKDTTYHLNKLENASNDLRDARNIYGLFLSSLPSQIKADIAAFKSMFPRSYDLVKQFAQAIYSVHIHEITHNLAMNHNADFATRQLEVQSLLSDDWSAMHTAEILPALFSSKSIDTLKWLMDYTINNEIMLTATQDATKIDKFTGQLEAPNAGRQSGKQSGNGSGTGEGARTDTGQGLGVGTAPNGIDSGQRAEQRGGPRATDELREPGLGYGNINQDQGGTQGSRPASSSSSVEGGNGNGLATNRARSGSFIGPYTTPLPTPANPRPTEFALSPVGEQAYLRSELDPSQGANYRAGRFGLDPATGLPPQWIATTDLFRHAGAGNALIRGEIASRGATKVGAYWYNNLLSGPAGAMTDIVSNALSIPSLMVRTSLAAGVEAISGVPLAERTATASMVRGMGAAMISGGYHGIKDFIHAFANGIEPIRGEQPRGMVDGKLGMLFEPISRVRVAADSMVFHMAEEMAVHGLAYREAEKEGWQVGTPQYNARVAQLVWDIADELANGSLGVTSSSPRTPVGQFTAGMAGEATRMAKEAVFQEKAPHLIGGLSEARGIDAGILNALVPFYRTIATIAYRGVDMTPVIGQAMLAADLVRGGVFGSGPYADTGSGKGLMTRSPSDRTYLPATQRIGNQIIGLSVALAGASLVLMGMMSDAGPDDEKERRAMMDDGWRPWSFITKDAQGKKHYTNIITVLGPAAFPLVFGAAWAGNSQRSSANPDYNAMGAFAMSMRDFAFTQSGLKAYDDALNALGGDKKVKGVELAIAKFATGLVPSIGLMRAINSATDPVLRTPSGMLFKWFEEGSSLNSLASMTAETAMAAIPGLSQYVPAKRNDIGDIQPRPQGQSGYRAFLPLQGTEEKSDSAYQYFKSTSNQQDAKTNKAISEWDAYLAGKGPKPSPEVSRLALIGKEMKNPVFQIRQRAEDKRRAALVTDYAKRSPAAFGR